MLDESKLKEWREEHEVNEQWRNVSYHVIADLLEVCSACGMVAEKERLMCCPSCEDTYCCRDKQCFEIHRAAWHPSARRWRR